MSAPGRFTHRGSVVATGFAIDTSLVGILEARRRVLNIWTPGAVVSSVDDYLLVTGLRPARIRAGFAPGVPLVEQHGVTAALPIDATEAGKMPVGAIVLARGGVVSAVPPAPSSIDVTAWIDLDDHATIEVAPLAPLPVRAGLTQPTHADVRTIAGIGPAAPGAAAVAEALANASMVTATRGRIPIWRRVAEWLSTRIAPRPRALPAAAGTTVPLRRSSWLDRLRDRLALALWNSRLGESLGRRHAAYLRRLIDMFDRGELDEALRHAIPLAGATGDSRLAIGMPRPRRDLQLSLAPRGASSSIPIGQSATELVRQRYRAALARLEQQGRIDDAAFVLAELLADPAGAVALLERHHRYDLAARFAESRELEPGLIVRLWFLAGDSERAIATARRYGAWADAVGRLERTGDRRAAALRLSWADHLATAGDYAQAVEVALPISEARHLLDAWIDRGIAAEGPAAARLLVTKLARAPRDFAQVAPAILAILEDAAPDAPWRRLALVESLLASPVSAELRTVARAAVRAIVADIGGGADGEAPAILPRLLRYADDPALRADQPKLSAVARAPDLADREPMALCWTAADAGLLPAFDAAALPGGRLLVALGEAGVRLFGRDLRIVAHFDQPATRLVVDHHGARALAFTPRGRSLRLARIDLATRRASYWCDAPCDGGAATFDGDVWLATYDGEVLAIDAMSPRWTAIWGVAPGLGPCTVRREGDHFAIEGATESWLYQGFTLRKRMDRPKSTIGEVSLVAAARPGAQGLVELVAPPLRLRFGTTEVALTDGKPLAFDLDLRLAAVAQQAPAGVIVTVVHLERGRPIARLELGGAAAASVRLDDGSLTMCDDRGRVLVIDLRAGAVRRTVRLAP